MGGFPKLGYRFGGPNKLQYSTFGSIFEFVLGSETAMVIIFRLLQKPRD